MWVKYLIALEDIIITTTDRDQTKDSHFANDISKHFLHMRFDSASVKSMLDAQKWPG